MLQTFFTFSEQSKENMALQGHLRHPGTLALEEQLDTRALKALWHLATQALEEHSDTWALEAIYSADCI